MQHKFLFVIGLTVLLVALRMSAAMSQTFVTESRQAITDPQRIEKIAFYASRIEHTARISYSFAEEKQKSAPRWIKRCFIGGMLVGFGSGAAGGLVWGHHDFTVGAKIIYYGGIGAGVGAGVGALIGKILSER